MPDIVMDAMGHVHCTWRDKRTGEFQTYFALDASVKSTVKVLTPNGGETFAPGDEVIIEWNALDQATSFDLYYSVNGGVLWKEIFAGWVASPYHWTIPPLKGKKKKCFVKVLGFDAEGHPVGGDRSDRSFAVEAPRVTYPSD